MKKIKKAQFSVEYLIIIGLVLVVIIPAILLYYSYSRAHTTKISASSINDIGLKIVENAKSVYSLGEGSWVTLELSLPENIKSMQIPVKNELVIEYFTEGGVSEAVFFSDINLTTTNPQNPYILQERIGLVKFKIRSTGGEVVLEEVE